MCTLSFVTGVTEPNHVHSDQSHPIQLTKHHVSSLPPSASVPHTNHCHSISRSVGGSRAANLPTEFSEYHSTTCNPKSGIKLCFFDYCNLKELSFLPHIRIRKKKTVRIGLLILITYFPLEFENLLLELLRICLKL